MSLSDFNEIPGWCNFWNIYMSQVYAVNEKAHFVEVGAWLGRSTQYMANLIKESNKNIRFDVVDTWEGQDDVAEQMALKFKLATKNYTLFDAFKAWMNKYNVLGHINPIQMTSIEAAQLYDDNSLDFVFLDADHRYKFVIEDLKAWWPKIKSGKVFAGHDYDWPGVKQAVDEFFNPMKIKIKIDNTSWVVGKPK